MRVAVSNSTRPAPILVTTCVTLQEGDVYRLPPSCRAVWVVSGRAWMTHAGEDIVLDQGDQTTFTRHKDPVVITSTGRVPLVLEIGGR